jgi:hypothetical protein
MKTDFCFHLDQKVTTWMRTHLTIRAESYEEAKAEAIRMVVDGDIDEIPWDEIDGVKEVIKPHENEGQPTQELFHSDGFDPAWDNKPISKTL